MAKKKKKRGGGGFSGGGGSGGGGSNDSVGSSSGGSSSSNDDSSSSDPIETTDPTKSTDTGLNKTPLDVDTDDTQSSGSDGDSGGSSSVTDPVTSIGGAIDRSQDDLTGDDSSSSDSETDSDTTASDKKTNEGQDTSPQEAFEQDTSETATDSTDTDSTDYSDVGEGISSPGIDAQAEEFTDDGETAEAIDRQTDIAESKAADEIDQETDLSFTEEDVEATTTRDESGELVIQTQLTDEGEAQADLEQDFQQAQLENEVFNELQRETEATLTRDQVDISTDDGSIEANLTDAGLRQEAAAQSDTYNAEDFLVSRDGQVFVSNEAQREEIAANNPGLSPEDVVLQDERQADGSIDTTAEVATPDTTAEQDTQIDQSVSRFESLTGVDIPGEGQVIPDIDVSQSVEDATGVDLPTQQQIGNAAGQQVDRVTPDVGVPDSVADTAESVDVPFTDISYADFAGETQDAGEDVAADARQVRRDTADTVTSTTDDVTSTAAGLTVPFTDIQYSEVPDTVAQTVGEAGNVDAPFTSTDISDVPGEAADAAASGASETNIPFTRTAFTESPGLVSRAVSGVASTDAPFTDTPIANVPGRSVEAGADATSGIGNVNIPFTSTPINQSPSLVGRAAEGVQDAASVPESPEGTNPYLFALGVQGRSAFRGTSEQQARESLTEDQQEISERTNEGFSPAIGRSPGSAVNLGRGIAGITAIAGGIFAGNELLQNEQDDQSELQTPEDTSQSELEVPQDGTRNEIEVPEEETAVQPEELGVPRDAVERGDVDITGPDGTRVTDDGDIIIPAGTTAVSAGTRQEDEEREDVVEEEAEEDAENAGDTAEEEDEVQVNVPEELIPDEEQTIGEEGTEADEDDLTAEPEESETGQQEQEEAEEPEIPLEIPRQRQAEQDAEPDATQSDEQFDEVEQDGEASESATPSISEILGTGSFGTVSGAGGSTQPTLPGFGQEQQERTDTGTAGPDTGQQPFVGDRQDDAVDTGQPQAQAPGVTDALDDILGQRQPQAQGQPQGQPQTPATAVQGLFGNPSQFDNSQSVNVESQTAETNAPATANQFAQERSRRRRPRLDFDLDQDSDGRDDGLFGDSAPVLTSFRNPVTGEVLETSENPNAGASLPGLGDGDGPDFGGLL